MGARAEQIVAFIRLGRPQFLGGGFLLYGLGAAVALAGGATFRWSAYLLGQAAITCIQLMTHYSNDYFDLAADQANTTPTRWSGGSRILPAGTLHPRVAFIAACLLGTMGLALTTAVAASGGDVGPATAGVLLLAQVLAWFYSAPPLVLHSRGLGEAATAVVVTGLTPLVAFMLQSGDLHVAAQGVRALALALIPLLGLQFAMLLAIEFPDAVGDAATGKRTLVVRLGGMRAAALLRAVLVVVYGSIPLLVRAGMPPLVAIGAIVGGPLAALQFVRVGAGEWAHARGWDALTTRGVALVAVTAAGELAGFACVLLRV